MRTRLLAIAAASALVGWLTVAPGLARAAETRPFIAAFGSLSEPHGLAVDQATGNLYVADTGNARVVEFDSSGTLIRAWGWGVADGLPAFETCTLSCGVGVAGSGAGQFTIPAFVAIDQTTGDVYVADLGDGIVSKFTAEGELISSWGSGGQLDGSSTTAGSFGGLAGIAVDASRNLLVLNEGAPPTPEFVFAHDGTFSEESPLVRGTAARGAGVDAGGHLFKANGNGTIEEFDSAHQDIGQVSPEPSPHVASAFTIEPATGDLYVATASSPSLMDHYAFNGSREVIEPDASTCKVAPSAGCNPSDSVSTQPSGVSVAFEGSGIAVASATGDTYISNPVEGRVYEYGSLAPLPEVTTGRAAGLQPSSAVLHGTVDPSGAPLSDCHFEYGTEATYGQSVPCAQSPGQIGSGSAPVPVSAEVKGLAEGVTYHFRLDAADANGAVQGQDEVLTTTTKPAVDLAAATKLTRTTAELLAKINPDNGDTTYRFEYGATTEYGASIPIPNADIGEGSSDVSVAQSLVGLKEKNITYHFRVVAQNAAGVTTTPDHTFVYDTSGGGLPDGRAYEMVTPPAKNDAVLGDVPFGFEPQVAEDGSRLILDSTQCFAQTPSCVVARAPIGTPYAFTRSDAGWTATSLAPPATQFEPGAAFRFSANSGAALYSIPPGPGQSDDFYVREPNGSFVKIGPVLPPSASPDAKQFAISEGTTLATADIGHNIGHMMFSTQHPEWPFDPSIPAAHSLYEYSGTGNSEPKLVGLAGESSTELIGTCGTDPGTQGGRFSWDLSADGSTAFFTVVGHDKSFCPEGATAPPANGVYARIDGSRTVALSARSALECETTDCQSSPPGDAAFVGAGADGSRAFFTDTQKLTDSASQDSEPLDSAEGSGCTATTLGTSGCNLYLYDSPKEDPSSGRNLIDVSAGDTSGHGPRVQGVMALSSDGSHVYFLAQGVLTSTPNSRGQTPTDGADNLYGYERDAAHPAGAVAFIATLPESDAQQWVNGFPAVANATPDGRFLVFASHAALTPDNARSQGPAQIYRYDALTGQILRISVGDHGFNDNGNAGVADASIAPLARTISDSAGPWRSNPTMSRDGAYVFFQSPVALTSYALNDVGIGQSNGEREYAQNIYEYHEGQVHLISDGKDVATTSNLFWARPRTSGVELVGTDESGANVFFTSTDQLVPQDTDTQLDYYDARLGGGFAAVSPQTPCSEGCHPSTAQPPAAEPPGSSTFDGPGNFPPPTSTPAKPKPKPLTPAQKLGKALKECRVKHNKHKRAICEAQARKRYGSKPKSHKGGK